MINQLTDPQVKFCLFILRLGFQIGCSQLLCPPRFFLAVQLPTPLLTSRTIGVFGAGWVGLVTGGCFAELGHDVIVRDVMPERIEALRAGQVPFHEADLPDVLERNRDRIRYTLDAGDLAHADALFICVQTPPTYSGEIGRASCRERV